MNYLIIPFAERFRRAVKSLSPVGYWPLIDDSQNIALGYENQSNGVISGALPNKPGKVDNAFSFDGITNFVDVGLLSLLQTAIRASTPVTISFLIATTETSNKWMFGRSDAGNTDFLGLMINRNDGDTSTVQNKLRGFFRTTDNTFHNWGLTNAFTNLTDGNFHLISFVISPGDQNYKIMIDGVAQSVTVNNYGNGNLSNFTVDGDFYIGGVNGAGTISAPLSCKVQHFFVLNRAITTTEHAQLAALAGLI